MYNSSCHLNGVRGTCWGWHCCIPVFFQWHALDRSEQAKYYDMARKEKELHLQLYPGWSARDNYASHKKKKRKREQVGENNKGKWFLIVLLWLFCSSGMR